MMKFVGSLRAGLLLVSPIIVCTGCWEEVHYTPSKQAVAPAVLDDTREELAHEDSSVGETVDDRVADAQTSDTPEVSVDDLFVTPPESSESDNPAALDSESADAAVDIGTQALGDASIDAPPSQIPQEALKDSSFGHDDVAAETETSLDSEDIATDPSAMPTPVLMRPSRTAFAVWRMASRWSMAAAIYAKEQPAERYRDFLDQATYAADIVGVNLPPLPVSDGIPLEVAVISYLLDSDSNAIVQSLGDDYDPAYSALAELAIRTNALLLIYTPKSQRLDSVIASIRQSAEKSHLPPQLWLEMITMLERRDPFADVKQRVLAFHTEVSDYLAGEK